MNETPKTQGSKLPVLDGPARFPACPATAVGTREVPEREIPAPLRELPPLPGQSRKPDFAEIDFHRSPFLVIWEVTQACDLACAHCRAVARPWRDPGELTTAEGFHLLEDVRKFGRVLFVLTGGDPLYRPDIFRLIRRGTELGLRMTMTPSGTPRMTKEKIRMMKDSGLVRLAVSLDGHDEQSHDAFRRVEGSFRWTMNCIRWAREIDLEVQVNTTVSRFNLEHVCEIAEMLEKEDIALWSVFFLVPVGRGAKHDLIRPAEHEGVFHLLYDLNREMPYDIKTTAAQHFRRVTMQRAARDRMRAGAAPESRPAPLDEPTPGFSVGIGRAAKGVNDGKGLVFVSHTGEVMPSGFLPVSAGNVRRKSIVDLYRDSELFRSLRDPDAAEGKCGYCDFADVCGGSRARAYGITGNLLASEPYCTYRPARPGSGNRPSNTYKGPAGEAGSLDRRQVMAALRASPA